jgi:sphinganine-1-phosphate aldolase
MTSTSTSQRARLPEKSEAWEDLRKRLTALGADDVDWRNKKSAVYVFHPGDDVLDVAKEAYALYQSENALGPAAFPSLRKMEEDVIGIALNLFHCPEEGDETGAGNMTSGGTESIILATKTCRDAAAAKGIDVHGASLVVPRTAHLAFDKAAHYLGLEIRRVDVTDDYLADPEAMRAAMDDRTIMIVGSAPCFP